MVTAAPPKTTFSQPGDDCRSCLKFWKGLGQGPQHLVLLPQKGDYGTPMVVCPFCDGPVLENNGLSAT